MRVVSFVLLGNLFGRKGQRGDRFCAPRGDDDGRTAALHRFKRQFVHDTAVHLSEGIAFYTLVYTRTRTDNACPLLCWSSALETTVDWWFWVLAGFGEVGLVTRDVFVSADGQ